MVMNGRLAKMRAKREIEWRGDEADRMEDVESPRLTTTTMSMGLRGRREREKGDR
jgi:hypothetical protein